MALVGSIWVVDESSENIDCLQCVQRKHVLYIEYRTDLCVCLPWSIRQCMCCAALPAEMVRLHSHDSVAMQA